MPYTVKYYGTFNPYYVKLYGDFGRGLKVIYRRPVTEIETEKLTNEDELLDDLPEENVDTELSYKVHDCPVNLLFAWKPVKRLSKRSTAPSRRRYSLLIELKSSDDSREGVHVYKLYSSKHKQKVEVALQEVQCILQPIAAVSLSEGLLKALILPEPKSVHELPKVMSDYIMKTAPQHKDHWNSLIKSRLNERSLLHHASELNVIAVLKSPLENNVELILGDPITGTTLVHLAVQHSHERLRETLAMLRSSLPNKKYQEYISRSNRDGFSTVLNARRRSVAVSVRKQPSVSSLSVASEELIISKSSNRDRRRSSVKVYSFELGAVTPIMLAVRKKCVRSIHYLLVDGADPNYQDPVKGMTALHIAAVLCNVSIVKLLLAFDADLTVTDAEGKTPIDIAKEREGDGTEECVAVMEKVAQLRREGHFGVSFGGLALGDEVREEHSQKEGEDSSLQEVVEATVTLIENEQDRGEGTGESEIVEENEVHSKTPTVSEKDDDYIVLLSFDGGGTQTVVAAYLLYKIEQKMRLLSGDPDLQICYYFNWYVGTSFSSLFALSMSHKNATTNSLMSVIVSNRDQIFGGRRIYSSSSIEHYCQQYLGDDDITSVTDPKVLVTTTQADRNPPSLVFITNYREDQENGRSWKLWEAARASSAVPTYFPSFEGKYIDTSGMMTSDSTLHALHDIHSYDKRKVKLVLSLGTGDVGCSPVPSIVPKHSHFLSFGTSDAKYLRGVKAILTANATNTHVTSSHSKFCCEMAGAQYHRLSPPISKGLSVDAIKDDAFVLMFYECYLFCLEIEREINTIATSLLELGPKRH